jgi:two-component sensor histidine kinase/HAMP domain-containing protein
MDNILLTWIKSFWSRIQPRSLRARIMTLISVMNLAILVFTVLGVNIYVHRVAVLPVGMFILLFATTLVLWLVLTRIFLKPIEILRDGAARVGDGEQWHRINISRMDELGEVMAVFNRMMGHLEAQHLSLEQRALELETSQQRYRLLSEQLERRVNERTAELQQLNAELRSEVNERKRAEERLSASLQEKDVLLREVHHRVKNNLQIISSLLNLQSQNVIDARTLDVLSDSQNRVRSMVLIHEKLYQSDNLERVNFGEYIRSLVPSLLRSYQRGQGDINIQLGIDEIPLPLEQAILCGLIVNELVTNALKYAFPQEHNGTLWIELHTTPAQGYVLRVADDGVGLPFGLDFYHPPTLGLQLVNSLAKQLEGTLEVDRQNGTAVQITF